MASFSVPPKKVLQEMNIDSFKGCDFTSHPANVDKSQSPNAFNIIRDVPGKIRKRMGYYILGKYTERINGCFYLNKDSLPIVHTGTALIYNGNVLFSDMNNALSSGWQVGENLIIADGKTLVACFAKEGSLKAVPVSQIAKVPLLTISKAPTGGGTSYESLNLLQPKFCESFLGTATDKVYQLSFGKLDDAEIKAEILSRDGVWTQLKENIGFSVNRQTGTVTFTSPPGVSPAIGEDNVKITASRTVSGYAQRINCCDIGVMFGINGTVDRLFLSGNNMHVNYDWYSGINDATYFADTAYSILGQADSPIVGYTVINNMLAAHKNNAENERNVVLRSGTLINNKPAFKVENTLQGAGAIAKRSFAYLAGEPLFLTGLGVYAITAADITGEKYAQNRSYYINGRLLKEQDLQGAVCCVYKDMYFLCINKNVYVLDTLQPLSSENMPYSTRQYSAFFLTDIEARIIWQHNNKLYFGGEDGSLCAFYDNAAEQKSYNDNGKPIKARWELADIDGKDFFKNKSFKYLAVRLASAVATGIDIYVQKRGVWSLVKQDYKKARYFAYSQLNWNKFTWSNDTTSKLIATKLRIKKVDKARFAIENSNLNEPLGIFNIALQYTQNNNIR